MRDIVFHRVMAARDARRLELRLFPDGRFEAWSRLAADPAAQQSLHASGVIAPAGLPARSIDLATLRARMPDHLDEDEDDVPRIFSLGPRWHNNPHTWTLPGGDCSQMLLQLELAGKFAAEANEHALHPTLLDSATSAVHRPGDGPHLPFLYAELRVHRALPARLFAHVRRTGAGGGSITADVDLIAPDGRLLAQVVGYTMRKVDRQDLRTAAAGGDLRGAADPAERAGRAAQPDDGIVPQEGGKLLLALLQSRHPGQVAVEPGAQPVRVRRQAPGPLASPAAAGPAMPPAQPAGKRLSLQHVLAPAGAASGTLAVASPAAGTPAAGTPAAGASSGAGGLEARLQAVWTDAIGELDIDRHADFFDLGGTSLSGVGMMTDIRRTFGVELPIAALFDYPTITAMAEALWEQGAR